MPNTVSIYHCPACGCAFASESGTLAGCRCPACFESRVRSQNPHSRSLGNVPMLTRRQAEMGVSSQDSPPVIVLYHCPTCGFVLASEDSTLAGCRCPACFEDRLRCPAPPGRLGRVTILTRPQVELGLNRRALVAALLACAAQVPHASTPTRPRTDDLDAACYALLAVHRVQDVSNLDTGRDLRGR